MSKRQVPPPAPPPDPGPPSSTANPSVRGAIDALVQGSLVELFQAYGVAVAPSPRSSRERLPPLPDVSASITFTSGEGARKPGRLTLSVPSAILSLMRADPLGGVRQSDWARELTNQLMGRIKNRLLQFTVRIQAHLPMNLESKLLAQQLQNDGGQRVYAGRTLRGNVIVTLEGLPHEAELAYVGPSLAVAAEGEVLFF
jgi:hypothetical protein